MAKYPTYPTLFDDVLQISISILKKWKYLEPGGIMSGTIRWSRNENETAKIGITVNTCTHHVELDYRYNKEPIKYTIQLVSLPSNLGKGEVWYFCCPKTNNLCRKLYFYHGYFVGRRAIPDAMYRKQTESKRYREFAIMYGAALNDEYSHPKKYAKLYYRGKPTPRQKKFEKWEAKLLRGYNLIKEKGYL
jgi:hypothetical protein